MTINGKDIKFRATVLAICEMSEHAPDGDIKRFFTEQVFNPVNYALSQKACAVLIVAMNKGYEYSEKLNNADHIPQVITMQEVLSLSPESFNMLFTEAYQQYLDDCKLTVQTEKQTGKKTARHSRSG